MVTPTMISLEILLIFHSANTLFDLAILEVFFLTSSDLLASSPFNNSFSVSKTSTHISGAIQR